MLPKLQAEESIRESTSVAVGSGALPRDKVRQVTRQWDLASSGGARRPRRLPPAGLASVGIGYRVAPRNTESPA